MDTYGIIPFPIYPLHFTSQYFTNTTHRCTIPPLATKQNVKSPTSSPRLKANHSPPLRPSSRLRPPSASTQLTFPLLSFPLCRSHPVRGRLCMLILSLPDLHCSGHLLGQEVLIPRKYCCSVVTILVECFNTPVARGGPRGSRHLTEDLQQFTHHLST